MSHIAISQPRSKRRQQGTFWTRVLNECIHLLPLLRLPGYSPMPPWDLVDPRPEEGRDETPPADADQPPHP